MKKKGLSLFNVVSLGVGSMVGAGIFALLGQVILSSGTDIYWAFLYAGMVALFCGYSYAKLSQIYTDDGGIIDYFKFGFKPQIISSVFSFIYLFTLAISIAMLAKSFGIYVIGLLPMSPYFSSVFGVALILMIGLLNLQGSKHVGRMESILVGIKVSVLLVLVACGFYYFFSENFNSIASVPAGKNFWQGVAMAFFAYAGFGIMANASGEVKRPERTIPLAIFIAISFVILLYLALAFVVVNFVSFPELVKNVDVAVASASSLFFGKWGFLIMSLTGLIALASGVNALFYSAVRIIHSMTGYDELPKITNKKILDKVSIGFLSLLIFSCLACIFVKFGLITKVSSLAFLVSYMGVLIAHFSLRKKVGANLLILFLGFSSMAIILFKMIFTWN